MFLRDPAQSQIGWGSYEIVRERTHAFIVVRNRSRFVCFQRFSEQQPFGKAKMLTEGLHRFATDRED
jgi:hypothetical protein